MEKKKHDKITSKMQGYLEPNKDKKWMANAKRGETKRNESRKAGERRRKDKIRASS